MNQSLELKVKYRSTPNIAWIKYWGKYDEEFILPINDSLGVTLNSQDICTETSITFSQQITQNVIILNNKQHPISKRVAKMFDLIKSTAYAKNYKQKISLEDWNKYKFRIQSINSFPTASGMASSASGLACLAVGLNGLFGGILDERQISQLARLGSGSASRSVCGGLVRWKGVPQQLQKPQNNQNQQILQKLSKQCISFTVVPDSKLRNIKILILLANNKQKQISSTSGMSTSVKTSQLIVHRNKIANKRIQNILQCLQKIEKTNDKKQQIQAFNTVMETIIKDSNQFHAICLDTYPPIFYLNQFSKQIITIVDNYINPALNYKIAYTFDAGPHAFLFMHESVQLLLIKYLQSIFQLNQNSFNATALSKLNAASQLSVEQHKIRKYQGVVIKPHQIWSTNIGCGAYKIQ